MCIYVFHDLKSIIVLQENNWIDFVGSLFKDAEPIFSNMVYNAEVHARSKTRITKYKETKQKTHKTNNHCTVGRSILKSYMDMEVDRQLSSLHDIRGRVLGKIVQKDEQFLPCSRQVYTILCKQCSWQ